MVDDLVFYAVLIVLIALVSVFLVFLVTLKNKFASFGDQLKVSTTLHAALFGYESALIELIGTRGYRTHVFPKIIGIIHRLKDDMSTISDIDKAGSPLEAMTQWMKLLESVGIVKNGSITTLDDGAYKVSLPHCSMCNPIHEIMGEQKGICPMALILTGAGTIVDPTKEVSMEYSEFSPTGTETVVRFDTSKGAEHT